MGPKQLLDQTHSVIEQLSKIAISDFAESALTIGNHSYILAPSSYVESESAVLTLLLLDEFEKTHPHLVITNWQPYVGKRGEYNTVLGIFIDHQPKNPKKIGSDC